jgi:type IV secretory pathway TrbF-like protein
LKSLEINFYPLSYKNTLTYDFFITAHRLQITGHFLALSPFSKVKNTRVVAQIDFILRQACPEPPFSFDKLRMNGGRRANGWFGQQPVKI